MSSWRPKEARLRVWVTAPAATPTVGRRPPRDWRTRASASAVRSSARRPAGAVSAARVTAPLRVSGTGASWAPRGPAPAARARASVVKAMRLRISDGLRVPRDPAKEDFGVEPHVLAQLQRMGVVLQERAR